MRLTYDSKHDFGDIVSHMQRLYILQCI